MLPIIGVKQRQSSDFLLIKNIIWHIPKLWDAIRFEVDHRGELGQFVLTGSAVPVESKDITHSGTGRFAWLTMRPMSLYESGDSNGQVSLKALRKIFVVEDMLAWNPNLRSKTAIRSADTRYYVDPSIATAALGIGPKDLINDLKTFGFPLISPQIKASSSVNGIKCKRYHIIFKISFIKIS